MLSRVTASAGVRKLYTPVVPAGMNVTRWSGDG